MMTIGERIKSAREAKGMTQRELAEALGVTAMRISQWECDFRTPRRATLERIAQALGVSPGWLMFGE